MHSKSSQVDTPYAVQFLALPVKEDVEDQLNTRDGAVIAVDWL